MWKRGVWARVTGKRHICLHSSYSSLGVHFWSQTVPLFSWSVLLGSCLVGLSLLGQEHSWVLGRTPSPATLAFCSSLSRSASPWMASCRPFYCPKWRSQPLGTPAVAYQRHQSHSLRALSQSRWCMWPNRNCSPAHKQQGLALAVPLPTPCVLADALPDADPRRIQSLVWTSMPFLLILFILF